MPFDFVFNLDKFINNNTCILCLDNEKIIGLVLYSKKENYNYINDIYVSEKYRNRGISNKLLSFIPKPYQLEVSENNIDYLRYNLNKRKFLGIKRSKKGKIFYKFKEE